MLLRTRDARALCVVALVAASSVQARATTISLDEAVRRAKQENPVVQESASDVELAEGGLLAARTYPHNPELGVSLGPAFGGGETFLDWEVSLGQIIELGGKRSYRVAGAEARRGGAGAKLAWNRWLVEAGVRRAYFLGLVARARVETAKEAEAVAGEIKKAAQERLRLGAATQLEVNVAIADEGKAVRERLEAENRYQASLVDLGAAIGAPANDWLEPEGAPSTFPELSWSEDDFVAGALAFRPDLAASRSERQAAAADLDLAGAEAVPDLSLVISYGQSHEPGLVVDSVLVGVSLPIPLWNRNQGGGQSAQAGLKRAQIAEGAARRDAERDARGAHRMYRKAREAVLAFDKNVVEKLGENLDLARESYLAGKIGLVEFNVLRKGLVEARTAYLDALTSAVDARFVVETAAGKPVE
jgi:cobalt-zinc-cadmium efflux system outer membrane protein